MESEKVQDNQVPQPQPTETAEKNSQEKDEINPLINVPPIENGNPETEKKEDNKKEDPNKDFMGLLDMAKKRNEEEKDKTIKKEILLFLRPFQ